MKLAILGTGKMVQDLLTTLHKVEIESLSLLATERSRAHAEQLAATYGIGAVFYDYAALLASDVDTVYIALPNHLHFTFARQALQAGKHLIIEKPITSNTAELAALTALAAEKQLMVLEAMNVHALPSYRALRASLPALGDLRLVSLNYSQYSSRYAAFQAGEVHAAFDPQKSGGALMDINIYNVHFAIGLFGKPQAVSYQANIQRGIDTSGVMILDYGSFKCVCIGAKDCQAPTVSVLQGEKASISLTLPVSQAVSFDLLRHDGTGEHHDFTDGEHRLLYEFQAFARIIDGRDFATAEKLLTVSRQVAEVMEEGRRQQGIVFPADTAGETL